MGKWVVMKNALAYCSKRFIKFTTKVNCEETKAKQRERRINSGANVINLFCSITFFNDKLECLCTCEYQRNTNFFSLINVIQILH